MRSASGTPGVATRVPSASGTRRSSDWAPVAAPGWRCTQWLWYPARQISQVLSEAKKDPTTKSPTLMSRTADPTSSTTPTYSWPIGVGRVTASAPRQGHRSEPQMQEAVTRRIASVGSMIVGASRSTTRTSPGAYMTALRMVAPRLKGW